MVAWTEMGWRPVTVAGQQMARIDEGISHDSEILGWGDAIDDAESILQTERCLLMPQKTVHGRQIQRQPASERSLPRPRSLLFWVQASLPRQNQASQKKKLAENLPDLNVHSGVELVTLIRSPHAPVVSSHPKLGPYLSNNTWIQPLLVIPPTPGSCCISGRLPQNLVHSCFQLQVYYLHTPTCIICWPRLLPRVDTFLTVSQTSSCCNKWALQCRHYVTIMLSASSKFLPDAPCNTRFQDLGCEVSVICPRGIAA